MSDLISREEVKAKISQFYSTHTTMVLPALHHVVDNVPSADVRENIHGHWERMSDLPEDKDDRYKCSRCGNVVHHSNGVNLYTFNSWCGRCGSLNNSLLAELESHKAESEVKPNDHNKV